MRKTRWRRFFRGFRLVADVAPVIREWMDKREDVVEVGRKRMRERVVVGPELSVGLVRGVVRAVLEEEAVVHDCRCRRSWLR